MTDTVQSRLSISLSNIINMIINARKNNFFR